MKQKSQHPVYSQNVIEFVTVAAEYCAFLENSNQQDTKSFIEKMTKIIPLLYLKASLLPSFKTTLEEEGIEQSVTEEEYEFIRQQTINVIGEYDEYLEVFHPDMQYSDSPVLATISEDLADVYQDLKDMIVNFRSGDLRIMNDALVNCTENFRSFWGQKLLNALRALHNVLYSE
jgi:nitrate/nitrite-specific signal transduction histidine kinase